MHLQQCAFDQQLQCTPHQPFRKSQCLEAFLVQEMRPLAIAVQVGGRNQLQVRLLELVARLEGLFKDRTGKQVALFYAHQGLTAASGGGVHFNLEIGVRDFFKLEYTFALDADRVHQCSHEFLTLEYRAQGRSNKFPGPLSIPGSLERLSYVTRNCGGNRMKYLCMVLVDEKKINAMSEKEAQELDDESLAFDDTLKKKGHLLAAQALESVSPPPVVRLRSGKVSVTDGPFAETNEHIGGFLLIEAQDLNEAIQLAAKVPAIRLGGIEVRPVKELTSSKP